MRLLTIALLCGCGIDPFETPSAYDQHSYLCNDLAALEQAANTCKQQPEPCAGYISFQGQIQLVRIRVDTTLERGIVHLVDTAKGEVLSRVEISGAAPYFHFDTAISSLGTPWPYEPTEPPYELRFDSPDSDNAPALTDDRGAVQWYIRAGSDTAMLSSNPAVGKPDTGDTGDTGDTDKPVADRITVTRASDERVDLQFAGSIGPVDDVLDACAIVFPQDPPSQ